MSEDAKDWTIIAIDLILLAIVIGMSISGIIGYLSTDAEYSAMAEAGLIPDVVFERNKAYFSMILALSALVAMHLIESRTEKRSGKGTE